MAQGTSRSIDPLTHVWSAEHVIGISGRSKLSQESQFEILLIDIGPNSPKQFRFSSADFNDCQFKRDVSNSNVNLGKILSHLVQDRTW